MTANPSKIAEAVQHALDYGFAAITFNKDSIFFIIYCIN